MNKLKEQHGDKLEILAFPCNQLGWQEWFSGEEITNALKYCRPGKGFEPKAIMMEKVCVNGADTHPMIRRLKEVLPARNTSLEYEFANPHGTEKNGPFQKVHWSPASPSDIIWNFEWFLVAPDGKPFKRYHPHPSQHAKQLEEDLDELLGA